MVTATTKEWEWAAAGGAQTNAVLDTMPANHVMVVLYGQITCSNSNSVDVGIRVGFASATLPAAGSSGATGVFMSHPGIAKGGGMVVANGGAVVAISAAADKLLVTHTVPTGGSIRLVLTYRIQELLT